jgi:MFS family permease
MAGLDGVSAAPGTARMTKEERKVIIASSVGTICEWYDFFLYGSLAAIIGTKFFGAFDETTRNIFALLVFALGFLVRPFGALLFGLFGDLVGRKYTFLATVTVMGVSTLIVGLLPTSDQIGIAAPIALITLRILQGLAVSGEFGGAVIYIAEYAPPSRRGYYTGWIPAFITVSVLFSLAVILLTQSVMTDSQFKDWGWRVPFIASLLPFGLSLWTRLKLKESPVFSRMKAEGRQSRAPIREAFGQWKNLRLALIALFAINVAVPALGYTGTFYTLIFMTSTLKVDTYTGNLLFSTAIVLGAPLCVFASWLSDRIGRKLPMLCGCLLGAIAYFPAFHLLTELVNPALYRAQQSALVTVMADPSTCAFQLNLTGTAKYTSPCDVAKSTLARASVAYTNSPLPPETQTTVKVGDDVVPVGPTFARDLAERLAAAGYPAAGNPGIIRMTSIGDMFQTRALKVIALLFLLVVISQIVQGPASAAIVELFPANIRYTAMSLPYQLGSGWIGGLLPATMFAMNAASGSIYFGLWYPIAFVTLAFFVNLLFLPETRGKDITA